MTVPLSLSSVPAVLPYIQYVATGGQTVFPYPFPITQDADLVCVVNGVTQATDSGYTLSGQGNATGGNLTFTLGRTSGDIITLFRNVTIQRLTQIGQNSGFSSTAFNAEFNNIYLILQQLQESITLSLQIPNTNSPGPTTGLTPANYANKYLSFDANGNPTPAVLTSTGSVTAAQVASLLSSVTNSPPTADLVRTASEISNSVIPVNYTYAPGVIDRYATNTTPGTTDMTTALTNALLCNPVVYALGATYKFSTASVITAFGKRIIGAGANVTTFQFPSTTGYCLQFGGTDTASPGMSGVQIVGNSNAAGGILFSQAAVGMRGALFSDLLINGCTKAGTFAYDLQGSLGAGIYDNFFFLCRAGTTGAGANAGGWRLTTTDAPGQPNRVNQNSFTACKGNFSAGDGWYINYASENTFTGCDREQNTGWGVNIQGVCPCVTWVGGDSEGNTSGSFNKASTSSAVVVLGGNVTEAAGGAGWNQYDKFFPNGTLAGNFGVDNLGNLTLAGTIINLTGTNPAVRLAGAAAVVFNTAAKSAAIQGPGSVNGLSPPAQVVGWGTTTGPGVVNNFPGATATLVQCSTVIAQLIKDLKAFGLYGA